MNKQQIKDSDKCDQMDEQGESMECVECSCSVCIAHENTDIKSGLARAIEIIKAEKLEAKEINPTMAFGMSHVLRIIEEEIKKC